MHSSDSSKLYTMLQKCCCNLDANFDSVHAQTLELSNENCQEWHFSEWVNAVKSTHVSMGIGVQTMQLGYLFLLGSILVPLKSGRPEFMVPSELLPLLCFSTSSAITNNNLEKCAIATKDQENDTPRVAILSCRLSNPQLSFYFHKTCPRFHAMRNRQEKWRIASVSIGLLFLYGLEK